MPRTPVFRTFIQDPWQDWDPRFLREIGTHASWIAVRLPGLGSHDRAAGPYLSDDPMILHWEAAMKRLITSAQGSQKYSIAFSLLQFCHYPNPSRPLQRGEEFPRGLRVYECWARTLPLSHRIDLMLRYLRAETALPIVLAVEDFSARWALRSRFRPDLWVMDNPMVGRGEAMDLYARALSRPGLVRRSAYERLRSWDGWKMHIRSEELLAAQLPNSGVHTYWSPERKVRPPEPITRIISAAECHKSGSVEADPL